MSKVMYYRNQIPWVVGNYQIWTMNPDGTNKRQLTTLGSNTDPAWQL